MTEARSKKKYETTIMKHKRRLSYHVNKATRVMLEHLKQGRRRGVWGEYYGKYQVNLSAYLRTKQ